MVRIIIDHNNGTETAIIYETEEQAIKDLNILNSLGEKARILKNKK